MKSLRLSLLLLASTGLALAQCPNNTSSPHFSCTSAGGNTQITLFADAELSWDRFDVSSGGSLNITSSGGLFSSQHLTPGSFPSTIAGPITADGAFTLLNTAGINVSSTGSITAPGITLSTLPTIGEGNFQGNRRSGQMIISGELLAPSGNITLLGYQTTVNGSITASNGKAILISTRTQTLTGPDFQRGEPSSQSGPRARVTTRGAIEAPIIEIYSEGFIQNSGRIEGGQVILEASGIAHDKRPGSSIIAKNLITRPDTILDGTIIDPNDGANPGGVSTTLGLPDLATGSFAGTQKTTLLPTQFSASNLSRSRIPSAVSKRKKTTPKNRLATRGAAKTKPVSKKKKKSAKKRSFFGIVTTK